MRIGRLLIASLAFVAFTTTTAHAGVRVGIGIGIGVPCYPCYRPYYYGYPYPYYAPGAVVVGAPAPVVVGSPSPVVVGSSQPPAVPAIAPTSAPPTAPAPPPVPEDSTTTLPNLTPVLAVRPEYRVRSGLSQRSGREDPWRGLHQPRPPQGRSRGQAARCALFRKITAPAVREAAARGLGLIASPSSLTALQNAAQSDQDRDVRAAQLRGGDHPRELAALR